MGAGSNLAALGLLFSGLAGQFVIFLWRGFIYVKILEWNVKKSASRLIRLRAKGGIERTTFSSLLTLLVRPLNIFHTSQVLLFLTSTVYF